MTTTTTTHGTAWYGETFNRFYRIQSVLLLALLCAPHLLLIIHYILLCGGIHNREAAVAAPILKLLFWIVCGAAAVAVRLELNIPPSLEIDSWREFLNCNYGGAGGEGEEIIFSRYYCFLVISSTLCLTFQCDGCCWRSSFHH